MTRKPKKPAWSLDWADVRQSLQGSMSGGRSKASDSRANELRASRIVLLHAPTGLEVEGTVPEGHYSRGEMRTAREALTARLFVALEKAVARRLRIPGR